MTSKTENDINVCAKSSNCATYQLCSWQTNAYHAATLITMKITVAMLTMSMKITIFENNDDDK